MGQFQSSSPRLQTLQPNLGVRAVTGFSLVCLMLVAIGYIRGGVSGAGLAGLGLLAAIFLVIQYGKERALANNRQTATAVVKEYTMRCKYNPHQWKGMPHIKYSFVAFDQKLYEGPSVRFRYAGTPDRRHESETVPLMQLPLRQ